jgi:hypothetical protein
MRYAGWLLIGCCFIVGLNLAVFGDWMPSLQRNAILICKSHFERGIAQYDWIDETQIVYLKRFEGATAARAWDVQTQTERALPNVNEGLRDAGISIENENYFQLSPQRGLLLCGSDDESNRFLSVVALKKEFTLKIPLDSGDGPVCWISECALVQFARGKNRALIFEWDKTNTLKEIPITIPIPIGFPLRFFEGDDFFQSVFRQGNTLEISRIRLGPHPEVAQKIGIPVAGDGIQENPEFSIDGRKLAWIEVSPGRKLKFEYHFPFFGIRHPIRRFLVVADIETRKVRKIGLVPEGASILCLRWVPDSNNISYMTADGIYTVCAE